MAASRALFVEKHYIAVTIDDIAQAAGIGRATFYLHFQSKEEVFQEMIDEGLALQLASFQKLGALDNPSRKDLKKWVEKVFSAYAKHSSAMRLFSFAIGMDAGYIEKFSRKRDEYIAALSEKLVVFQPAAERKDERRRIAAHLLLYRIEQLGSNLAYSGSGLDRAIVIECATDALEAFFQLPAS